MEAPELLETLRKLEIALHAPGPHADAARIEDLLHPSFREFGRSGAEYTRDDVLRELTVVSQSQQIWSQDFRAEELAPGLALVTYRTAHIDPNGTLSRYTNRASVWQLTRSGWSMRFHQGTPTKEFDKHV